MIRKRESDRRNGADRRCFSYGMYVPEKRLVDRRSGIDRRKK